jgi:hypothetical protein
MIMNIYQRNAPFIGLEISDRKAALGRKTGDFSAVAIVKERESGRHDYMEINKYSCNSIQHTLTSNNRRRESMLAQLATRHVLIR